MAVRASDSGAARRSLETASTPGPATTAGVGPRAGSSPTGRAASPTDSAMDKQLRELLQDRLGWLEEYDKATIDLKKATAPERSPEQQWPTPRSSWAGSRRSWRRRPRGRSRLLPAAFRGGDGRRSSAHLSAEMKDALEAATNDLKEWKAKLETLRTEVANWEAQQNARRAERDKLFQRVASLKARAARARRGRRRRRRPASARLAQERLVNAEWESRVEAMRLQVVEAADRAWRPSWRRPRAELAGLPGPGPGRGEDARADAESLSRGRRPARTHPEGEGGRRGEHGAAVGRSPGAVPRPPHGRPAGARGPGRQERAGRWRPAPRRRWTSSAAWPTTPRPTSPGSRPLLDDGRVSRLDAIRLNNDFRRIGPERDRLLRNEMAIVETRLQYYEDALTNVEIELLQDSLHDRYELDLLRERLPAVAMGRGRDDPGRARAEASGAAGAAPGGPGAADRLHGADARPGRAAAGILDEEYWFIRTHIFWVRDQEPIGLGTITQGAANCQHPGQGPGAAGAGGGQAPAPGAAPRPSSWPRPWPCSGLPIGLVRLRRCLRGLDRARPARDTDGSTGGG